MNPYFEELSLEIRLPWNGTQKECLIGLENAGVVDELKPMKDKIHFHHHFESLGYEVILSFPANSRGLLRTAMLLLKNDEGSGSRIKNTIRNFRLAYSLLTEKFGEPLDSEWFTPEDDPHEMADNIKNDDFPEVTWNTPACRILLEVNRSPSLQAAIHFFCQLPIPETVAEPPAIDDPEEAAEEREPPASGVADIMSQLNFSLFKDGKGLPPKK